MHGCMSIYLYIISQICKIVTDVERVMLSGTSTVCTVPQSNQCTQATVRMVETDDQEQPVQRESNV